jgi:hypothetical protein
MKYKQSQFSDFVEKLIEPVYFSLYIDPKAIDTLFRVLATNDNFFDERLLNESVASDELQIINQRLNEGFVVSKLFGH